MGGRGRWGNVWVLVFQPCSEPSGKATPPLFVLLTLQNLKRFLGQITWNRCRIFLQQIFGFAIYTALGLFAELLSLQKLFLRQTL